MNQNWLNGLDCIGWFGLDGLDWLEQLDKILFDWWEPLELLEWMKLEEDYNGCLCFN